MTKKVLISFLWTFVFALETFKWYSVQYNDWPKEGAATDCNAELNCSWIIIMIHPGP